ncbi:MAG: FAD-dependent oxidoreductase [Puniceicoccales bacterium]|jgi:NADPH-dependent 2,4-dienoyl-CoA reductase/sulfur reductase-like enzyme/peroxiredoxin family protein/TusA-related sulfurtransferase/rhodanese-related sulfurtransferase|nr:FAD-dependent oxidoreductase [Puniceicoccales bacterium]
MKSSALRLLIVGGVAAGASTAARARRLSEEARITLLERGPDVSFANCGLPYHIGGEIADRARLAVQTPESLSALLNLDVRVNTEAVAIDPARRQVRIRRADSGVEETLSYDKLVLATGSVPVRPPLPGIENPRIHTLRSLRDMDAIKRAAGGAASVLIVGAGFIGIEMAEQLRRQGKKVALVEMLPQVLPQLDREMTFALENELRAKGVELVLGDSVASFDGSGADVSARLASGRAISADLVILSIGVKPESGLAAAAGIALGARGAIKVNEWMQTSHPDIYAAGDVVESVDRVLGGPMSLALGGPANRQGRVIASHIFLGPEKARPYPGHVGTAIVRAFGMAAGVVGWTEQRLKAARIPHETVLVSGDQHAEYYPGALPLTLKLLWSPQDGRVLGAQAFGVDGVDKRLDVLATALAGRMTIDDLAQLELAYAPPFGSARDVVNTVAFAAQNRRDGLVRTVPEAPADSRLLDVRPAVVAEIDPIPGALNIPFAQLRPRLGSLDRETAWTTVCSLGKTSYFAARVLAQNGFDVQSLSGGRKLGHISGQGRVAPPATPLASPAPATAKTTMETLDCCGLGCPGPLLRLKERFDTLAPGDELHVMATDPGFRADVSAWCRSANNDLISVFEEKGVVHAHLRKTGGAGRPAPAAPQTTSETAASSAAPSRRKGATVVVFSAEMDKVMAALVIANGAAALGGRVTLFFTFWGIAALRRKHAGQAGERKNLIDRVFGWMLPRGLARLPLSRLNVGGIGALFMKRRMKSRNLPNLPGLLDAARQSGVRLVACAMSMSALGIQREELMDGVELGGVADYLESAEQAGTNLFV